MSRFKLGNAPCSWGTIEGTGTEAERVPYTRMLDELAASGYTGTELGDYGFMPTEAEVLRDELGSRNLTMLGAYVDVALAEPGALAEGRDRAVAVARLLKSVADIGDPGWQPYLVLADVHSRDPLRFQNAGRVTSDLALSDAQLKIFAEHANAVAKAVRDDTGLKTVFHHHCAGFVETPDELGRFLELTDPELVGLVFDTGHYLYGSGARDPDTVIAGLERFWSRTDYVHLKDLEPGVAAQAERENWDYKAALEHGIFCELGQGCIDFGGVLGALERLGYAGWLTVEQDMLPGLGTPKESATRNREFLRGLGL